MIGQYLGRPYAHRLCSVTYTGNGVVARIIAKAAAEHLTPRHPRAEAGSLHRVIPTRRTKIAAKRVLYGKTLNAGQVRRETNTIIL